MYVLTGEKDVVICISETLNYQDNGNPLVHNDTLAIAEILVKHTYEDVEIPEKVCESKYCYTPEQGFYKNPDWREYVSNEQRIAALEDAVNSLLGF